MLLKINYELDIQLNMFIVSYVKEVEIRRLYQGILP